MNNEWATYFSEGFMFHRLSDRVTVKTDQTSRTSSVYIDGNEVSKVEIEESLTWYVDFLQRISKEAEILKDFPPAE